MTLPTNRNASTGKNFSVDALIVPKHYARNAYVHSSGSVHSDAYEEWISATESDAHSALRFRYASSWTTPENNSFGNGLECPRTSQNPSIAAHVIAGFIVAAWMMRR